MNDNLFEYRCPHCGLKGDSYPKKIKCPNCGTTLQIPTNFETVYREMDGYREIVPEDWRYEDLEKFLNKLCSIIRSFSKDEIIVAPAVYEILKTLRPEYLQFIGQIDKSLKNFCIKIGV